MKIIKINFFGILLFSCAGFSQTIDPSYQVGAWHGFRTAAISYTFDDGCRNQFDIAIPMFNEFGFRLTLFTVTRNEGFGLPNWDKLQAAADQGHEIAAHTLSHASFADLSDSLETIELRDCRDDIDTHITEHKCLTMAYPFCVAGNKSICAEYYLAARGCSGIIEQQTPRDFMAISSLVVGTESSIKTADNFISRFNSAVNSKGWCVLLLHGVDNDGGWSPVESGVLRETLVYLDDNQADYWVDTFGNVVLYILERDAVLVTETSVQDSSITVQVSDSLDNEIFNHPISIRRQLPDGWAAAKVTQNGQSIESKIVEKDSKHYIQFDIVPDGGDVVLTKDG